MGQPAHWKLIVRDESKPSFKVMLACGDKVVVGRSRTCEIILSDPSVSRKHCFFGVDRAGVLKLVDFGARHPTLLNGEVVKAGCSVPVLDGYQVRLGRGSFITAEFLEENLSSCEENSVDPVADDDLEHTSAEGLEKSIPVEVEDENPRDDQVDIGKTPCPENSKPKNSGEELLHTEVFEPVSFEENDEGDEFDERTRIIPPQHVSAKPVELSEEQDKTNLVNSERFPTPPRSDELISPKMSNENPISAGRTSTSGELRDSAADEETKISDVYAVKPSPVKSVNRPAPREKAKHNHEEVLGKTLQGKLIDPKKRKEGSDLDKAVRNGNDDGAFSSGKVVTEGQLDDGAQDETRCIDRKKKGTVSPQEDGAEDTVAFAGDSQDETNYVDQAELQKLMKGKGEPSNHKGGKKQTVQKREDAEKTTPAADDSQDETNYVDPAELQRLMKGKAGSRGIKGRKNGAVSNGPSRNKDDAESTAPSAGDSQDETNFVDPAELRRLLKSGAGKKGPAPRKSFRRDDEVEPAASPANDSQDETGYVDPAELKKHMKGKTGLFGKKGRKKQSAPTGTSRKGVDAGDSAPSAGDSQDETNFIDPVELQKLMKGKAKSPRSNKGKSK